MKYSIRRYHKNECVTFKSTKRDFGSLSNMAPGYPIKLNGEYIKSSELLYQALRFPEYPEIQKQLIQINSPITAKQFGRKHLSKTRTDWNAYRFSIMRFCIALKLQNNFKKFSSDLISTQGKSIVEFSDTDKVWGATKEGEYYVGTNALGRLLMELREKILSKEEILFDMEIPNLILENNELSRKVTVPNIMYDSISTPTS